MKTNKKALLGMLVAMVMSLGTLGGIQEKSQAKNEASIQQVAAGCAYNAATNEGRVSAGWTACSVAAGLMTGMTGGLTSALWVL